MAYFSILTILIVALDQISKYLVLKYLMPVGGINIIPGILNFDYVENRGAAFGMLADHRYIFMILSVLGIAVLTFYYFRYKPSSMLLKTSLIFICAGGCGNMIDRLFRGYVIDFINAIFIKFYVFNIADSFVCIGCALMVIYLVADIVREKKSAEKNPSGLSDDKITSDVNVIGKTISHSVPGEDKPTEVKNGSEDTKSASAQSSSPQKFGQDNEN